MAPNGGGHFEINIQKQITILNLFLKLMHTNTHLAGVIFVRYANNHFVGFVLLFRICIIMIIEK